MACHKDVDNGQKVLSKLLCPSSLSLLLFFLRVLVWACGGCCCCTVNHDVGMGPVDEPLDEVIPETTETVSVGHDNLVDRASQHEVQKPLESPALEVDPAANVLDDLGSWVGFLQLFDLALEVFLLVGAADSGIADCGSSLGLSSLLGRQEGDALLQVVQTVRGSWCCRGGSGNVWGARTAPAPRGEPGGQGRVPRSQYGTRRPLGARETPPADEPRVGALSLAGTDLRVGLGEGARA